MSPKLRTTVEPVNAKVTPRQAAAGVKALERCLAADDALQVFGSAPAMEAARRLRDVLYETAYGQKAPRVRDEPVWLAPRHVRALQTIVRVQRVFPDGITRAQLGALTKTGKNADAAAAVLLAAGLVTQRDVVHDGRVGQPPKLLRATAAGQARALADGAELPELTVDELAGLGNVPRPRGPRLTDEQLVERVREACRTLDVDPADLTRSRYDSWRRARERAIGVRLPSAATIHSRLTWTGALEHAAQAPTTESDRSSPRASAPMKTVPLP